jgi:hypothetical protein
MRRRSSLLLLCVGRSDRVGGGQTRVAGLTGEKPKNTPAREGPRRGRCTWVVLDSAGHLGRPLMSWM